MSETPELHRIESICGGTVTLIDNDGTPLPRGRYYRLTTDWIPEEDE